MADRPVPSFETPPIDEVVWEVQFGKLGWLTAARAGLFWQMVRSEYPEPEERSPVGTKDEPEALLRPQEIRTQIHGKPPLCRQLFVSEAGTELIQLQDDRFCFNWRRVAPTDVYPRYEHMREKFCAGWRQFTDFAHSQSGERPEVDLLEMTYVNNIFKDEGWSKPSDIGAVFTGMSFGSQLVSLPSPATLSCNLVFDIEGSAGRLHVSCRHAKTLVPEEREVIQLALIARGKLATSEDDEILAWFAKAREWIVRGFAELTDPSIQRDFWRRER